MTNQDETWQNQMKKEMENSQLTDSQKLEIAQKVENAKSNSQENLEIENYKKEMENVNLNNIFLQNLEPNLENKKTLESKIKSKINPVFPKNSSEISEENIKINFQISHIYIFIFIGIATVVLNIAVWSLIFTTLSIFNFYFVPIDYRFSNSGIFQNLMLIIFVYFNYKIHTKFLTKIFSELEIK